MLQVIASVARSDGGPSTAALEICKSLATRGTISRIITTDADGLGHLSVAEASALSSDSDLSIEWYPMHPPRRLKASRGLARAVAELVPKSDVVHIHGHYLFHSAVAAHVARRSGKPYVIQPHGVLEPYQRVTGEFRKAAYDAITGRGDLAGAAAFVFADQSEAMHARDIVDEDRAEVVGLGARLDPVPDGLAPPSWASDLGDRPCVVFLGRLAKKKRVDLLLRVWPAVVAANPDAVLIIAGPSEKEVEAEISTLVKAAPAGSVRLVGPVYGPAKTQLLERANLFVLPSENENFAISVGEALLAATPVVVSRFVATHRYVREFGAGTVLDSLEERGLQEAISASLEPVRNALMARGAAQAAPHLQWSATADRLNNVYKRAIEQNASRIAEISAGNR